MVVEEWVLIAGAFHIACMSQKDEPGGIDARVRIVETPREYM